MRKVNRQVPVGVVKPHIYSFDTGYGEGPLYEAFMDGKWDAGGNAWDAYERLMYQRLNPEHFPETTYPDRHGWS